MSQIDNLCLCDAIGYFEAIKNRKKIEAKEIAAYKLLDLYIVHVPEKAREILNKCMEGGTE